jgi:hypothetical protein
VAKLGNGGVTIEWTKTPEMAAAKARRIGEAMKTGAYRAMVDMARESEAWMKENRSWNDITGDARKGLIAAADRIGDTTTLLVMGHQVSYGIYLEKAHGGRYAVIVPAVYWTIPRLQDKLAGELRRALGGI